MDRCGGVDNYLLQTSDERLASHTGTRLRKLLIETMKRDTVRAAKASDAASAGAPAQPPRPDAQLR